MAGQQFSAAPAMANARRLRFLVATGILFVLWWVLLGVVEREAARAEQEGTRLMLNQIRSLLVVKGAEVRLKEGPDFRPWAEKNPFDWFESEPAAYGGKCPEGQPQPGQWCFRPLQAGDKGYKNDTAGDYGQVIFQPRQSITIGERQGSPDTTLAWVVAVEFTDSNGNGRLDEADLQSGLMLQPVEP
ncbi:hypothetical protein [Marinobacter sp. HL-58]|uniref:hypothetical protein n=1 Tax=Marinobacter sp. HL-58 TaxID=1479237 RepID=UPI00068F9C3F|nr:hypothetical protein [Marinobacter sp. HL-58]KPQ01961.1 MAG: T2bSS MSH-type system protein MshF [Marinobacter sp. HL-58]